MAASCVASLILLKDGQLLVDNDSVHTLIVQRLCGEKAELASATTHQSSCIVLLKFGFLLRKPTLANVSILRLETRTQLPLA